MRVQIENVLSPEEEGAVIRTVEVTENIRKCVELLENNAHRLIGYKDLSAYSLDMGTIYYFESVDNRCFAYTKSDCFLVKYKLYELELLLDERFFRCSKSMICNSWKIREVKPDGSGRMRAVMRNDEIVIISRGYIGKLKERLGL